MRTVKGLSLDPNAVSARNARWKQKPLGERFWSHVAKSDGCWLWMARRNPRGYGSFAIGSGQTVPAHRASWVITNGPLLPGELVLHKTHCTSKACVRPDHLYLGDQKQNMRDAQALGVLRGRNVARGETAGHAKLTEGQAREIIRRTKAGERARDIASAYGIRPDQVTRIARGTAWKHLRSAAALTEGRG